jgi:2-phosphosulfolactate phosphatase
LVIDVIRASSTIVALLDNGCRRVYTLAEKEKALCLGKEKNMLTSGEWEGKKLPGFDMENSPAEIKKFPIKDREVALCTSNGTRVIEAAKNCVELYVACLLNARACAELALARAQAAGCDLTLVCAGQYGNFVLDDAYCAGYLIKELELAASNSNLKLILHDAARTAKALTIAYPDARTAFRESDSGRILLELGGKEDFEYCLQVNISQVVPQMELQDDLIYFVQAKK